MKKRKCKKQSKLFGSDEKPGASPGFFVFGGGLFIDPESRVPVTKCRGRTAGRSAGRQGPVIRYRDRKPTPPEPGVSVNVTLVLTTVPDVAVAQKLAADALAARLCACVTQLGSVHSSYHWQGAIETAQEIQLLFKTSAARALELEQYIQAHHPYDTPEILSWQATASAAYGQWITAETQRPLHV
ncbi:uncharacterized protein involved in tolerance to divalent cations [Paraburkholderia atlantica]